MSSVVLSTVTTRAAVKLVNVVTKNTGANIAAYATYMTSAREDGLTIATLNRELETFDVAGVLPKRATLGIYAQAVDHGDSLALNNASDYAIVYAAISRVRRVKGYDLDATFAPIAELPDISDRRDAMRVVGTDSGLPIITRDGTPATPATPATGDGTPGANNADEEAPLIDDLVKTIARTTNAIKGATFTPEEYARLAVALNALGVAATKAKPGK